MLIRAAAHQFEITDGELIHPQKIIFADAFNGGYVLKIRMLGISQVVDQCACGSNAQFQPFNPKAF